MTALCCGNRRSLVVGGGAIDLSGLTGEGLDALYTGGWDALRRRVGRPDTWFLAEPLFRQDTVPVISFDEPFLVSLEVEAQSGGPPERSEPTVPSSAAARLQCLLYVHPQIRWFTGHFPGRPVLPGVVQIGWAVTHGDMLGFGAGGLTGLSGIKFVAPVLPGAVLSLTLARTQADRLSFVAESRQGVHSRGVLHYGG